MRLCRSEATQGLLRLVSLLVRFSGWLFRAGWLAGRWGKASAADTAAGALDLSVEAPVPAVLSLLLHGGMGLDVGKRRQRAARCGRGSSFGR